MRYEEKLDRNCDMILGKFKNERYNILEDIQTAKKQALAFIDEEI